MATETTSNSAAAWSPDVSAFAAVDVVPDALILQTSTVAGVIQGDAPAVRVAYVDDAAATFTAEGVAIDEANPALAEALVYTGKVTQLVRLSREQWSQMGTAEQLSESVRRAVTKKANQAYIAQAAPTAPAVTPPAGLLNISGIVEGDEVADSLDALIDLHAAIEGNGGEPSHLLVDPVGWARIRKLKETTSSNASLIGAGTSDAEKRLLDLPTLVTPAMSASSGMIVDRTAIVSAVGDIEVATSEHVYFNSDSIALRCVWRIGWTVVRANRIGSFTVADPDAV